MFFVDLQTTCTCMSLYNFTSIYNYPSLRCSLCFFGLFFSTIDLQYISHLKQKIVENDVKLQVYMYVCKMSKF